MLPGSQWESLWSVGSKWIEAYTQVFKWFIKNEYVKKYEYENGVALNVIGLNGLKKCCCFSPKSMAWFWKQFYQNMTFTNHTLLTCNTFYKHELNCKNQHMQWCKCVILFLKRHFTMHIIRSSMIDKTF